jgi:hypothetical protein
MCFELSHNSAYRVAILDDLWKGTTNIFRRGVFNYYSWVYFIAVYVPYYDKKKIHSKANKRYSPFADSDSR